MDIIRTDNLIIGAGPSGLAMAGQFSKAGVNYILTEKSEEIAHRWYNHYDRLHLHTVKEYSALPFMKFPEHYPTYVSRDELITYYQEYVHTLGIKVQFGKIFELLIRGKEEWIANFAGGKQIHARNVIFATGVNRVPNYPHWNNMKDFQKEILHSRYYKNPKSFEGKKVLVVGFGNTGAEIALDLANHGIEVAISVRSPVIIVPRDVLGKPVQHTAKMLDKLPYPAGDMIGSIVRKLVFGNLQKYGIPVSREYPINYLKKTGKTPVINIGTVELIKQGKIKILPDIDSLEEQAVLFENGKSIPFDTIILCTGYRPGLEGFFKEPRTVLNKSGYPKEKIATGINQGLYFIGYDNFSLGGILGTIPEESDLIAEHILKPNS